MKPTTRNVLDRLRVAPATTHDLCQPEVGGIRFGGRIKELRDLGYIIDRKRVREGSHLYTLIAEPEEGGMPNHADKRSVARPVSQRGRDRQVMGAGSADAVPTVQTPYIGVALPDSTAEYTTGQPLTSSPANPPAGASANGAQGDPATVQSAHETADTPAPPDSPLVARAETSRNPTTKGSAALTTVEASAQARGSDSTGTDRCREQNGTFEAVRRPEPLTGPCLADKSTTDRAIVPATSAVPASGSRTDAALSYGEFLRSKARAVGNAGVTVDPDALHPLLYEWQRESVLWALEKGRCALFWDCGLGKTFAQTEWARLSADRALIIAPLSVARQTVREAAKLDVELRYVRSGEQVNGDGLWITNYEMVEHFDPRAFGAVVLDESSILKNVDGSTRRTLTELFARVPRRLACTATPAPNDVAELTNHAEFLGVMSRAEMLAAYFVNDEKEWRLKGHAAEPMFRWMASWAQALRRPSDLGYPDDGWDLPPLEIVPEIVTADIASEGQLFATDLGGIGGRAAIRRQTLGARVERAAALANDGNQWIIWCGLNDEANACSELIDGAVNVEGSWSPDAKAEALEAFQDGTLRVLITKPSIAGFGMNFQNASRMAFVGLGDSYESYYQSIRRCWRFGQTETVRAHIVVSELEQQIVANVRRKEREAERMTARLVTHMNNARGALAAA